MSAHDIPVCSLFTGKASQTGFSQSFLEIKPINLSQYFICSLYGIFSKNPSRQYIEKQHTDKCL